jgi:ribose transport system permease protein
VTSAETASFARRLRRGMSVGEFVERFALVGAWIVTVVVFSVLKPGTFANSSNFAAILGSQAVLVVLTCGLLIPLTAGDYDLSITGVLTLSQMLIGILNTRYGISVYVCIVLALLMGALVGLTNGAFVVLVGIDSFIVTLGTGTFLGGVVLWMSNSETFAGISSQLTGPVVVERFLGVPLAFYYGLALVIVLWYFLEYTSLGRQLLFVGRSRSVARLSGLRVARLRWGALVASGVIAAAAGVLYAGITGAADPVSGAGFLLPAFAAAFLGATSIVPGRFNPWGSFIAVYFLVTGITGLALFGIQSWFQDMFYGGALVLAVTFSQIARRREEHESGVPAN